MSRLGELEALFDDNPDDPFITYALAREHEQSQSTMKALMLYEHLVNHHPAYIATYYHYAKLLHSLGNPNEAKKLLKKGIEEGMKERDMHAVSEMRGLMESWD